MSKYLQLGVSDALMEMFLVVIQLGGILAVILLYWRKLLPFTLERHPVVDRRTLIFWGKVLFASIPAVIIGYFLEDKIEALFYNEITIAIALIVYGVLFILIEVKQKNATPAVTEIEGMPWRSAFIIGLFSGAGADTGHFAFRRNHHWRAADWHLKVGSRGVRLLFSHSCDIWRKHAETIAVWVRIFGNRGGLLLVGCSPLSLFLSWRSNS